MTFLQDSCGKQDITIHTFIVQLANLIQWHLNLTRTSHASWLTYTQMHLNETMKDLSQRSSHLRCWQSVSWLRTRHDCPVTSVKNAAATNLLTKWWSIQRNSRICINIYLENQTFVYIKIKETTNGRNVSIQLIKVSVSCKSIVDNNKYNNNTACTAETNSHAPHKFI